MRVPCIHFLFFTTITNVQKRKILICFNIKKENEYTTTKKNKLSSILTAVIKKSMTPQLYCSGRGCKLCCQTTKVKISLNRIKLNNFFSNFKRNIYFLMFNSTYKIFQVDKTLHIIFYLYNSKFGTLLYCYLSINK